MARETLIIQIRSDGARRVQRDVRGIGTTANTAQAGVQLLRRALLFVGVFESIRRVTSVLSSFGQAMATVRGITNATEVQFEALRLTAIRLGAETRFSATEAAEGLLFLSRAGFTVQQSLQAVEGTLKLAQAGNLGLGRAADIASNVLRGFRLNVDQTARVVDVLALAANSSNTTVEQLGDALKFVGPIASGLGLTLEETTAAISELSNAGLQASLAGTGLRRVLSELESPSAKTRKEIDALGISIERGEISTIGLLASLQRLEEAGVDTGRALEIFGDRGGPAFEVMSGGTVAIAELTKKLLNAEGTVDRIAAIMDDTLFGALKRVASATETVIIAFGDLGGEGVIRATLENLATVLRAVAKESTTLEGILTGLAVLVLPALLKGVRALTLALLKNPIFLIGAALAIIIGLLVKFRDQIFLTSNGMVTLGDFAKALFELLITGFKIAREVTLQALENIRQTFEIIFGEDLPGSFEGFVLGLAKGVDFLIGIFSGIGAVIIVAFENPFETVGFLTIELVNFIIRSINALNRFVSLQIEGLVQNIIKIAAAIPGIGQGIIDDLSKLQVTLPQIDELPQKFSRLGTDAGAAFIIGVEKSTQAQDLTKGVFDRAREIGKERARGPTEEELAREKELNDLLSGRAAALEALTNKNKANTDATKEGRTALDGFKESFNRAKISAEDFGAAIGDILISAIDQLSNAIADAVVDGIQDFENFKENLNNIFRDIIKQIIATIIKALILRAITEAISSSGGGGGGGGGGGLGVTRAIRGFQAGGPVRRDEPVVVGERGRELFVPPSNGRIERSSQVQAPQLSVTIVNAMDEDQVLAAIGSSAGEELILNTINNNPETVKRAVG